MGEKEEDWSKERIQAEMKDLERGGSLHLWIGISLLMGGFGGLAIGVMMIPMARYAPIFGAFPILGVVLILGGAFFLRKYLRKRRKYNELKAKL